jgi:osmotically-inducible protein OsmY
MDPLDRRVSVGRLGFIAGVSSLPRKANALTVSSASLEPLRAALTRHEASKEASQVNRHIARAHERQSKKRQRDETDEWMQKMEIKTQAYQALRGDVPWEALSAEAQAIAREVVTAETALGDSRLDTMTDPEPSSTVAEAAPSVESMEPVDLETQLARRQADRVLTHEAIESIYMAPWAQPGGAGRHDRAIAPGGPIAEAVSPIEAVGSTPMGVNSSARSPTAAAAAASERALCREDVEAEARRMAVYWGLTVSPSMEALMAEQAKRLEQTAAAEEAALLLRELPEVETNAR